MRLTALLKYSLLLLVVFCTAGVSAQRVFINDPSGFFEFTGTPGNCTHVPITNECVPTTNASTYSMAVFKDTVYYLNGSQLYSFKLGVPGSCRYYRSIGNFSSMTIDPNGILYFGSSFVMRYNPYTNQLDNLGNMPFGSAGDFIFYGGKLLMAGSPPGIYEIDLTNPMNSTLYMGTNGLSFYGLISYPVPCGNSRFFGLAPAGVGNTAMYELDLLNKTVLSNTCNLVGRNVYDAGSTTETGLNAGITITNFQITQPCPPATTGQINIQGVLDALGITYTLDNTITNTTGIFNNVAIGPHTLRLSAGNGCVTDTSVVIRAGLDPLLSVQKADANNCEGDNGSVTLAGNSGNQPILYQWQGSGQAPQPNGTFNNLLPGTYRFLVSDAAGCSTDTTIAIALVQPVFVTGAQVSQSRCGNNNGSIRLLMAGGDTTRVSTSLNGAAFLPRVSYANLMPGAYNVQARHGSRCFFDTTIVIVDVLDPKPLLAVQVANQRCYDNNGAIGLTATAAGQTFEYQLNGAAFGTISRFDNLAPGTYQLRIRNQNGCAWDTSVAIGAYPKLPVLINTTATNPDCEKPKEGSIRVSVNGTETPYRLLMGNNIVGNGQLITGLTEGDYTFYIQNKDGCTVDSVKQALTINVEPRCITVYVPTAFSPNGDGRNDFFRPLQTYFTSNMRLQVFNRFGQMIYNGTGPNVQWDGTFKGTPQLAGTYVYWLTYTDYLGVAKKVKGNLVLIR